MLRTPADGRHIVSFKLEGLYELRMLPRTRTRENEELTKLRLVHLNKRMNELGVTRKS